MQFSFAQCNDTVARNERFRAHKGQPDIAKSKKVWSGKRSTNNYTLHMTYNIVDETWCRNVHNIVSHSQFHQFQLSQMQCGKMKYARCFFIMACLSLEILFFWMHEVCLFSLNHFSHWFIYPAMCFDACGVAMKSKRNIKFAVPAYSF